MAEDCVLCREPILHKKYQYPVEEKSPLNLAAELESSVRSQVHKPIHLQKMCRRSEGTTQYDCAPERIGRSARCQAFRIPPSTEKSQFEKEID